METAVARLTQILLPWTYRSSGRTSLRWVD